MPREEALKRLAQLLAERIKTSTYADVLKPVQSFRDIPPESKFWALPTGESVVWSKRGPHHASVIQELGFRRPPDFVGASSLPGMESAIQAGRIRGESGRGGGELSAHIGQRPDTILAVMDLIRAKRPEFGWIDVDARVPKTGDMASLPLRYEWSKSGDLMRKLTRLIGMRSVDSC